jgi:hypothetical protein
VVVEAGAEVGLHTLHSTGHVRFANVPAEVSNMHIEGRMWVPHIVGSLMLPQALGSYTGVYSSKSGGGVVVVAGGDGACRTPRWCLRASRAPSPETSTRIHSTLDNITSFLQHKIGEPCFVRFTPRSSSPIWCDDVESAGLARRNAEARVRLEQWFVQRQVSIERNVPGL